MIKEPLAGQVGDSQSTAAGGSLSHEPKPATPFGSRQKRLLLLLPGVLAVVVVALVYRGWQVSNPPDALTASGTLEADETLISAQVSGAITTLPVPEGTKVSAGAIVAKIDDRLIQLQMQEADVGSRRQLELQQENYVLRAPIAGIVTRVPAKIGETAMPGQVLLAIAPTDRLKLTVYVHEAEIAGVSVGQQMTVTADPFPNRAFSGSVTSVNTQAEFTPRNVQTRADRLNLVFGVQALVSNPDGALKPGMPVDVRFEPLSGS